MTTGTQREVVIPGDGVDLAATLYLPDPAAGPQPCLLEALPYRKDDLTSSYAESYEGLRDRHAYAVCRLDLRGTGSSPGDATDEYPAAEQRDLRAVIAWLADQEWCDGKVGMFGTSYSGFNSLQLACERPPALGAICAIYATDDRWTDDVHWRGGALRLIDLVDYCHYMTPMNLLPPVPAVWGEGWEQEWQRRLADPQPWLLTWLEQRTHGPYWAHGSVRLGPEGDGYDRIACPVMLVAGWADGYRNNTFRTVAALAEAGVPHRLLAGPWAHADATNAMPGPRIDLETELAGWFDTHLRGQGAHEDRCDVFVRGSTRPEPDLDLHEGFWLSLPSVPPTTRSTLPLSGPRSLAVDPSVGTTAWIDCAGHLPWGLSLDQRTDDARSLTWDDAPPDRPLVGHPVARLRISADAPAASLSVKLCDVFPDGTSALVSRGTLDLAFRDGVHGGDVPLVPGEEYDVEVVLDACAYEWSHGQRLRLSVAGADWPNTVSPPAPLTITVHHGELVLPLLDGTWPEPTFTPGAGTTSESEEGIVWSVTDDVLHRTTVAHTLSESEYDGPYAGRVREHYEGEVRVDRRTFEQRALATTVFGLTWPEAAIEVSADLDVRVGPTGYDVAIETRATRDGEEVHRWSTTVELPRYTFDGNR
ncbi:CocE/NonD family hydrolase [Nocardioides euryhalodurans]|uniref:CocE/NonD family hydrolase n=1 Tax=Nocardioides euryhalodurans TaxID=2518370 RepID=A0A4P7GGK4_9ACTN|nr:CocE/NonD family hydrolase [Nocardioides euryhalodurans]QBR90990.1 CocE/NonD family hydrolase [Nocardioides euryhalodurans]